MGASHSEIGHNWAHQLKSCQRDRYSFGFEGTKIRSYSTVIGEIVYTKSNEPIYFLNYGSYSNSTCKHQNYAFGAIPKYATVFSASCGEFMYGWNGIADWNGEITEARAANFVMKNLQAVYDSLLAFKDSKALRNEKEFSIHYFNEAVRFMEYFPLTSFSKILRIKNDTLKKFYHIENPTTFRKVVKVLIAGEKELKVLVDIACGNGTYDTYYKRTMGIRMVDITRKYNHLCGFEAAGHYDEWYVPYPYFNGKKRVAKRPKNYTYISHTLRASGKGFTTKEILHHREKGDLAKALYETRKGKFKAACLMYEVNESIKRKEAAKKRLEIFIGLRGFDPWCNRNAFISFSYNGAGYTFHRWNEESELTDEEYAAFGRMSSEERNAFIIAKRAEMLETLQQQDYEYEHRFELAEKARIERERKEAAKRKYIEEQKARGDEGLRQLWHENLLSSTSLWNQPITLFYGGNVLLKVAESGDKVVTSKGITIPLKECKRLWNIINRWHESKTEFCQNKEIVHATGHQDWSIQRYQNDIMIAGCHAIAYKEMATIAKQLNFC